MTDKFCSSHSGVVTELGVIKQEVRNLRDKGDAQVKIVVGILVSTVLNLVGVITLLLVRLGSG